MPIYYEVPRKGATFRGTETAMSANLDVLQVVLQLSQCKTLEEILRVLREKVRGLVGADGITIVLRDGELCHYIEEDAVGPLWKGKRFPMAACISGWCMIHRQQVVIPDIYLDARIPHDAYRPTFVKSLAMTPIRSSAPLGAIGAYWASYHIATPEELATLQALGDSAAMAIENSQLIDALQQSNRRKDSFLSMLAHELRNPLTPIRHGARLLQLQGHDPNVMSETCRMIERQVTHLSRLVEDLLDVARINTGKVTLRKTSVDLTTLVRLCVQDHRQEMTAAGITFKVDLPVSKITVDADSTRLTQVLSNLLSNASKFTPRGGSVLVRLRHDFITRDAFIEVEDTGVGIDPALLPRLFEFFTQADASLDRAGGGLGLGLAVAKSLTQLHGGSISAHSDGPGWGSRFKVILPNATIEDRPSPSRKIETPASSRIRLLIIEDNQDAANCLQKLMTASGFDVSVAYDGAAGLALASNTLPDVVLCDIGLPSMDGYEVATALRRTSGTEKMRLIAVTGYGADEDRNRARDAGFDSHMTKPIDLDELLARIRLEKTESIAVRA